MPYNNDKIRVATQSQKSAVQSEIGRVLTLVVLLCFALVIKGMGGL